MGSFGGFYKGDKKKPKKDTKNKGQSSFGIMPPTYVMPEIISKKKKRFLVFMQSRKKTEPKNSLGLAALFFIVFLFFFGLSIFFKVFFLIKSSTFDGGNTYNLHFVSGQKADYVSFSPQDKTISIFEASANDKVFAPVDGKIYKEFRASNISSTLLKTIFSPSSHTGLTEIDLVRLALFARTVPKNSVTEQSFESANEPIFNDPAIIDENKSIEIINASSIPGLGSKLATFISNMGGNVILVKSQEGNLSSKISYFGDESYTLKRINKFLKLPAFPMAKREVADVIIVIGKGGLKDLIL